MLFSDATNAMTQNAKSQLAFKAAGTFRRFAVVLLAPLLALLLPVAASLAVPPRGMVIESPKSHI
ncbi:MAG: hypothetical protein LBH65_02960, partial [Desulfovibrio sp.]|nr:hypothetical protein [Desulfovibrio sp.]